MTKAEMIQHLRMAACNENTVTGMANAFDLLRVDFNLSTKTDVKYFNNSSEFSSDICDILPKLNCINS